MSYSLVSPNLTRPTVFFSYSLLLPHTLPRDIVSSQAHPQLLQYPMMKPTRRIIVDDSQLQILRPNNMKPERNLPSFLAEPTPDEQHQFARMASRPR